MDNGRFSELFGEHKTGIIGAVIGTALAILILGFGILRVLFIVILAVIGYFIGNTVKNGKNWLRQLLNKILPPGTYR